MTEAFLRGICNVSNLAGLRPRTAHAIRSLTAFSDRSFRYHIPRRIDSFSNLPARPHEVGNRPKPVFSEQSVSSIFPYPLSVRHPGPQTVSAKDFRHPKCIPSSPWSRQNQVLTRRIGRDQGYVALRWQGQTRAFHQTHPGPDKIPPEQRGKDTQPQPTKPGNAQDGHPPTGEQPTKPDGGPPSQVRNENFYDRLHMPQFHRPTKEELLAAATGFWSRLRVRFKWLTIKSVRPFNMDEIFGFFSWIVLGHVIWIVIGTTTFVSLVILAINTVFAQETVAGWVGNYLTKSSGLKVVFESAIVPKWGDGVITFKNVYVSRRPGQEKKSRVVKGSPEAAAMAASAEEPISEEDQNYSQFDITIGEINVTLSFRKWWNSKGLLKNVEVRHVRGVVDRTHVNWTGEDIDPKSYRHEHNPGDFEIEAFKIEDLLVTVLQPQGFRPFSVSIYNADLPRLRKQWLFYDFLCANNITGEYDRSLFTIHPRQIHSYTGARLDDPVDPSNEPWKKQTRIRLDGLNIDHVNRGATGPLSWIHEGNVDIVADIMIPNDNEQSVMDVMTDFYERMEATLTSRKHVEQFRADTAEDVTDANADPGAMTTESGAKDQDKRFLVMDLRIHLNDVRAVVPIFTRDLSYVNNALIRPIVAYINSRRTFIPINCRVVKRLSDFDGSWTVFDSGLMDDLSAEVYDAFARDVTDEQARIRRFKKVGLWSLQLAVQAIFLVSVVNCDDLLAMTNTTIGNGG